MLLSQKQQTFPDFFSIFFKSSLNFEYFEKKDDLQSSCISEITHSVVTQISKKSPLRGFFHK